MKNKEEKPEMPPVSLTDNLLDNLVELRALFGGSADLTIRRMTVCSREIALVTVEGMVDRHLMADAVILPMARMTGESASAETLISRIRDRGARLCGYAAGDHLRRAGQSDYLRLRRPYWWRGCPTLFWAGCRGL